MMNYYEPLLTKRYHIQSLFSLVAPSRHRHHGPGTIAPGSSSGLEIPWLHSGGVACLIFHAENLAENPLNWFRQQKKHGVLMLKIHALIL